jgi:hypothetical protein
MPTSSHKRAVACLGAALALAAAPRAMAQPAAENGWDLRFAVGMEMAGGDTTYRIAADDGLSSVESELEFPLHSLMLRFDGGLAGPRTSTGSRFMLGTSVLFSPRGRSGSGTMKDSDWLSGAAEISTVGAPHDGKDIYSESDAQLDALVLDARASWEFPASRTFVIAPMLGILYQRFVFDVSNVNQVGYGPYAPGFTGSAPGSVLDYRVEYTVPYVGARAELGSGAFAVTTDAWYSPFAWADDRDDHILRAKLSETSASGTAWQASLGARFSITAHDFLHAQASTVRVSTSGTQHQRFYAGPDVGQEFAIPSKITSARNAFLLSYVHRFAL